MCGYVLDRWLGDGAFATVWRAKKPGDRRWVALKVLSEDHLEQSRRLWLEGLVMSAIDHPNVVRLHEVLSWEDHPALVLEYVAGPSLAQRLSAGRPTVAEADALGVDVIRGVRAVHRGGVVHRDLKPSNILLAPNGGGWSAKVSDFGVALATGRFDTAQGRDKRALGTPRYMAPEQWSRSRTVDARADLFGVGCVLYEVLAGRPAFDGDDLPDLERRIRSGNFRPLKRVRRDLPARLLEAVERCLEVDPAARPADCDELLGIWTERESGVRRIPAPSPSWQRAPTPAAAPRIRFPPGAVGSSGGRRVALVVVAVLALAALVWLLA